MPSIEVIILVVVALIFDFWNGLHDSSNVVATMISTRALGPRKALVLAAVAVAVGPLLGELIVAETIGGLISPNVMSHENALTIVLAGLIGAIFWNIFTWFFGIPSSSSHALIGGLTGAAIAGYGLAGVHVPTLGKAALALFISPPLGLLAGYLVVRLLYGLGRYATPHINTAFRKGQILASTLLALSHGRNDAQKTMGVITLGLVISGMLPDFEVPLWVILASAGAMTLGTLFGGWRLIRTLGGKFYKVRPIHGLGAQMASATVILGATHFGGPVSTTHVVSSAILGAGSAQRLRQVRWGVVRSIVIAWFLTIPLAGAVSMLVYHLILPLIISS